jgi:hypothetical protein
MRSRCVDLGRYGAPGTAGSTAIGRPSLSLAPRIGYRYRMKMNAAAAILAVLIVLASGASAIAPSHAAELGVSAGEVGVSAGELRVRRHYVVWRVRPQDCFLMPDVIVALNALGPYCSSPRGYFARYRRY